MFARSQIRRTRDLAEKTLLPFLPVILFAAIGMGVFIFPLSATNLEQPEYISGKPSRPKPDVKPLENLPGLKRVEYRIRQGDSLGKLMFQLGLAEFERQEWLPAIKKHFSVRHLQIGQTISFYFANTDSLDASNKVTRLLQALELDLDPDWILTWEKGPEGIVFRKKERPYNLEVHTIGGTILTSLYSDGLEMGLHPNLISLLADIFAWEIDFETDLRAGATFKIMFERRTRIGKEQYPSFKILAAEIVNRGERYAALYFEKEKGNGNYYDPEGQALFRSFLRYPVEFSRISSRFTHSRLHPILNIHRPHYGVDFAARRGTPVRAVGDGRVHFAGWKNRGYGRLIEIKHNSVYRSRYAHLHKLARGIRRGVKVKKGQIIGYVGSSGLSNGPHLHYELYKHNRYVNPLKVKFPPEERIEPALEQPFEDAKQLFLTELDAIPIS